MKFLAVFAALVAVSASAPTTTWTLSDLSQAIQNPATPAALLPYLEHALNQMMNAIFAGQQVDSIALPTPPGLPTPSTSWTLSDLSQAIQNPATPAALVPYLEHALNQMMDALISGHPMESIVVPTPAGLLPVEAVSPVVVMPAEVDLAPTPSTSWTLSDLSQAIQNPATPAALVPYLEHALNQMMDALFSGHPIESIVVPTPAGLLPVDLSPAAPAPVPAPVVPAPVADAASPLVQIIVNIDNQQAVQA